MPSAVTRAAEGFGRRLFTVDEILLMQQTGIIAADENFELIEGEIVPMGPKYVPHERVKSHLGMALARACPPDLLVGYETSVKLSATSIVEPDLCLYRRSVDTPLVTGDDVILAIEVSVSSLGLDTGPKASLYAKAQIPELWIVDVKAERTILQTMPRLDGSWGASVEKTWSDALTQASLPGFSLRLADL